MASHQIRILLALGAIARGQADFTCEAGDAACTEYAIEDLETQEAEDAHLELLQHAVKVQQEQKVEYAPYWCYGLDLYTRSTIPSCNGGPGGCACLGPAVCGAGPVLPGTWQSFSYSCCACSGPTTAAPTTTTQYVEPETTVAPAAPVAKPGSECSAHPACAKLALTGSCCPSTDGTTLGCCEAAGEPGNTVAGTPAPTEAQPTADGTSTGKKVPEWCAQVPASSLSSVPACTGSGIERGGCECLGPSVCGSGAPKPGSWQSFSSACCSCK